MKRLFQALSVLAIIIAVPASDSALVAAPLEGNTFSGVGPWSVTWDAAAWEVDRVFDSGNGVVLDHRSAGVTDRAIIYGLGESDLGACLNGVERSMTEVENAVIDPRRLDGWPMPTTVSSAEARLYQYLHRFADGDVARVVRYVECRPLVEGEGSLVVQFITDENAWTETLPLLEELLGGVRVGAIDTSGTDAPGVASASPRLDGSTYTNDDIGLSITWDEGLWRAPELSETEIGERLALTSDAPEPVVETLDFTVTSAFGGDLDECMDFLRRQSVDDFVILDPPQGRTELAPDLHGRVTPMMSSRSRFAIYRYDLYYYTNEPPLASGGFYNECAEILPGETVLAIRHRISLPVDQVFENWTRARQQFVQVSIREPGPQAPPPRVADDPAATEPPSSATVALEVGSIAITNDDVKLRAAPSPDALAVADLARGTEVIIVAPAVEGAGFMWWPVTEPVGGTIGFVRAEFLSPRP